MTMIDADDAQNRLHEMWDALIADGPVAFARSGIEVATLRWSGSSEDRDWLLGELAESIGYASQPT